MIGIVYLKSCINFVM